MCVALICQCANPRRQDDPPPWLGALFITSDQHSHQDQTHASHSCCELRLGYRRQGQRADPMLRKDVCRKGLLFIAASGRLTLPVERQHFETPPTVTAPPVREERWCLTPNRSRRSSSPSTDLCSQCRIETYYWLWQ